MDKEEIQTKIDALKGKKAQLTGPKHKKKRYHINRKIKDLQHQLQKCIYSFPNDQFELNQQEYHQYFSHIEDVEIRKASVESTIPANRHELFARMPTVAKCMPALLIPLQFIRELGYRRIDIFWDRSGFDKFGDGSSDAYELLRFQYQCSNNCKINGGNWFDCRYVFHTEAAARRQFEDQSFINRITETTTCRRRKLNVFGNDKIAYEIFFGKIKGNKLIAKVIVWRIKSVIIKLYGAHMPTLDLKRLLDIADVQAQRWEINEDTVAQLMDLPHYQEFVIGLRICFKADASSRKKTYHQHQLEMDKLGDQLKTQKGIPNLLKLILYGAEKIRAEKEDVYQLRHRCQFCRKLTSNCCKCKKVYYCGKHCQKKDWQQHKHHCTFKST